MTRQKTELLQRTLGMLILKAPAGGPLYGYGVGRSIEPFLKRRR